MEEFIDESEKKSVAPMGSMLYVMTMMVKDEVFRYTWLYLLLNKYDAPSTLRWFVPGLHADSVPSDLQNRRSENRFFIKLGLRSAHSRN